MSQYFWEIGDYQVASRLLPADPVRNKSDCTNHHGMFFTEIIENR
jgi:hypothetical protein